MSALNLARLPQEGIDLEQLLSDVEFALVEQALARTGGNKAKAARLLGLNRTTLVMRLKQWRAQRAAELAAASIAATEECREAAQAAPTEDDGEPLEPLEPDDLNDANEWEFTP